MEVYIVTILLLIAYILGLISGVLLARPRSTL